MARFGHAETAHNEKVRQNERASNSEFGLGLCRRV